MKPMQFESPEKLDESNFDCKETDEREGIGEFSKLMSGSNLMISGESSAMSFDKSQVSTPGIGRKNRKAVGFTRFENSAIIEQQESNLSMNSSQISQMSVVQE